MKTDSNQVDFNKPISFTDDICADGICCFMSIPRNQTHLGMWKAFLKRRNASYGVKLLYTGTQAKDIVYNPCRCLEFYLKEVNTENDSSSCNFKMWHIHERVPALYLQGVSRQDG